MFLLSLNEGLLGITSILSTVPGLGKSFGT